MTPDASGYTTMDLGALAAGTYTLVAKAMYDDSSGTPTEVDSAPATFTVGSFTVKTNSWNPNPAYVGQIISGQVQGKFDPTGIDGGGSGPTFVVYNWTTAGVWYSQDGTAGTFEPYGGNGIVSWQQGQADTTFRAQFFTPGQYLLEVSCVATVYSSYNGSVMATFTGTGYIGGDASDIDTSGGTGHAHKAQGKVAYALKAHAGGGDGMPVTPATVTFSTTSVRLGLGSPLHSLDYLTVTVTPPGQVNNISFQPSNDQVTLETQSPNSTTGTVFLVVHANNGSTTAAPNCTVSANEDNFTNLATLTAVVIVPTSCTQSVGKASVTNAVLMPKQQPPSPDWNIPTPPDKEDYFATLARQDVTITIMDQFGAQLDSMYDGVPVIEKVDSNDTSLVRNGPITQPSGKMSGGTITDEVSVPSFLIVDTVGNDGLTPLPGLGDAVANWNVPTLALPPGNSPEYNNAFPDDNTHFPKKTTGVGRQTISVGGCVLTPVWDRGLTINPVNLGKPSDIIQVTETAEKTGH